MSASIFQSLCLRFKAGDEAASMEEQVSERATVNDAGEVSPALAASPAAATKELPVAQDSASKTEDQICVSTGTLEGGLLKLPAEIIDHIVSFLSPQDLSAILVTCQRLREHGQKDTNWYQHVQDCVPGFTLKSPAPCATYRELYIAHDPYWFLSKYKIWFCDYFLTGKFIVVRYDPRRGCIEGYRLVAERKPTEFEPWEFDDEVIIHSFEPKVQLHKDLPILQLDLPSKSSSSGTENEERRFVPEISMPINDRSRRGTYSNLLLARPVEEHPNMALWPPQIIPAKHRVRNASQGNFRDPGHEPRTRSEISDQTFRIRRWVQLVGSEPAPGVRLAHDVTTYSTLDPALYTPTAYKPYRGIWIGDYAGHGCEFLLIHQPDDEVPFDESSVLQKEDENLDEFFARRREERIYRGRLEAIKLTGDPNIPRGEITFVANDIGKEGFVRVADEAKFKGARIVKSCGHVAERLFKNDDYIESQLIMISPDRLAQFWVGFGHISYFERVNIDDFTSPFKDRPYETPAWSGGATAL